MKKLLPILLSFLAFSHIGGFMPFYAAALQEVKNEMALELGTNTNLLTVTVTENEYSDVTVFRKTGDDEFVYRGNMYDYKTVTKQGNAYVFKAVADEKETSLSGLLRNVYEQHNDKDNNSKSPLGNLFKYLSKDFVSNANYQYGISAANSSKPNVYPMHLGIVSKGYQFIVQMPPDIQAA
jgi:hypothetical protein